MSESVRQHALEKIAVSTAAVGGVSGATLGAAIGSALRYSSEPGEEQSNLTNPIVLGALGAGIGTLGGTAIDAISTNKPEAQTFDDTLKGVLRTYVGRPIKHTLQHSSAPGLTLGSMLGSAAGLYGIGAYAGNATARETIQAVDDYMYKNPSRNPRRTLKKLKARDPKLYNRYIKALVATGQLDDRIINTPLEADAKRLGLVGDTRTGKALAFLRRMRWWNPVRALSLGLLDAGSKAIRPNGWIRAPKTNIKNRISAFKALPGRKAKIKAGLKGAGKGAGIAATLVALGLLGKQVFGND